MIKPRVLNVRQHIIEFVDKEDQIKWANECVEVEIPKFQKIKLDDTESPGIYNFVRGVLSELKP